MRPYDMEYLQKAIAIAARARQNGNSPFGALLVDAQGRQLLEAENTVFTGRDATGHAETNLIRKASAAYPREVLAGCTVYTSTEPCAMCSAAIFWSGVSRVVYALSERDMVKMVSGLPTGDFLDLPCREVFERGGREIEVLGPLLEEEARKVHLNFW